MTGSIYPILTTLSIATQTSLYNIIGEEGCFIYWLSSVVHPHSLVIGGLGMAVFRLICVQNRCQQLSKDKLVTIIHILELIILCFNVTLSIYGMLNAGMERAGMYQFCKDFGTTKAGNYHEYINSPTQEFGKCEVVSSKHAVDKMTNKSTNPSKKRNED